MSTESPNAAASLEADTNFELLLDRAVLAVDEWINAAYPSPVVVATGSVDARQTDMLFDRKEAAIDALAETRTFARLVDGLRRTSSAIDDFATQVPGVNPETLTRRLVAAALLTGALKGKRSHRLATKAFSEDLVNHVRTTVAVDDADFWLLLSQGLRNEFLAAQDFVSTQRLPAV